MSQASCSWTPEMVDSLVRIYGDTISNSGKAADNGSLSKQQWSKVAQQRLLQATNPGGPS